MYWFNFIIIRATTILMFINLCFTEELPGSVTKDKQFSNKISNIDQNQIEKQPKKLIIGKWSVWGPWTTCSRTCGGGITYQIRHCINRPADSRFIKKQRRRRQQQQHHHHHQQQQQQPQRQENNTNNNNNNKYYSNYWKPANGCVGLYKRIHLCNTQDCPTGDQDFRYEQCAAFNNRPFKGRLYFWEPYYQAQTECTLNCQPRGMLFYATLNKTVIDGTKCYNPITSTGKKARKGTKGVCIDGYCKSVNSQGIIGGNDENPHEICQACNRGACKGINGIYTLSELPAGYSTVAQIPEGACGLHVQQLKHTRNFIALQFTNGSYILNGDWKFSPSRSFDVAGTRFTYIRQDGSSLETISAPGPLATTVNIMVVAYQVNPGIKYGYSIPIDNLPVIAPPLIKRPQPSFDQTTSQLAENEHTKRFDIYSNITFINAANQKDDPRQSTITTTTPSPTTATTLTAHRRTRLRRKYFHWKITGLTQCSKSCDGGTQTYIRTCYRSINGHNKIPVNEKRCAHLEAPALTPIPCNTEPCHQPVWDGFWGQCSVSCGEGIQNFIPQCKQDVNGVPVVISDAQCSKPKPTLQTRVCQERECTFPRATVDNDLPQNTGTNLNSRKKEWTVGEWSQCSVTCGTGHRSRSVTCPSGQCYAEDRPSHVEYCNPGSCDSRSATTVNSYSPITPQFRYPKPTISSSSISSTQSSPLLSSQQHNSNSFTSWLVTEWSHCSEQCGTGNQTRLVLCEFENCSSEMKPETSRACSSEQHCDAQWFAGPWGECSDSCNGPAKQKREILCIARIRGVPHVTNEMVCPISQKPHDEQACHGNCPPKWFINDWSKCEGNPCPSGIQKRDVKCLEINKSPSNSCTEVDRPAAKRSCTCETSSSTSLYRRNENRDKFTFKLAQDEPIDRSCVDRITKCRLAVQARLCYYPYYTTNCCKSCSQSNVQQEYYE